MLLVVVDDVVFTLFVLTGTSSSYICVLLDCFITHALRSLYVRSQIESCPYSNLDGCSSRSLLNLDDYSVQSSFILVVLLDLLVLCNAHFFSSALLVPVFFLPL
jgi:hypothetical protein